MYKKFIQLIFQDHALNTMPCVMNQKFTIGKNGTARFRQTVPFI